MEIFRFRIQDEAVIQRQDQFRKMEQDCSMCGTAKAPELHSIVLPDGLVEILEKSVCGCCGHKEERIHGLH